MYIAGTPGYRCTVHKEFILQVLQAIMYMRTLYCRYSRLSCTKGIYTAGTPGYHVYKEFILQVLQAIEFKGSFYCKYSRLSCTKGFYIAGTSGSHVRKEFILQVLPTSWDPLPTDLSLIPPHTATWTSGKHKHQSFVSDSNITHLWATLTSVTCERYIV